MGLLAYILYSNKNIPLTDATFPPLIVTLLDVALNEIANSFEVEAISHVCTASLKVPPVMFTDLTAPPPVPKTPTHKYS